MCFSCTLAPADSHEVMTDHTAGCLYILQAERQGDRERDRRTGRQGKTRMRKMKVLTSLVFSLSCCSAFITPLIASSSWSWACRHCFSPPTVAASVNGILDRKQETGRTQCQNKTAQNGRGLKGSELISSLILPSRFLSLCCDRTFCQLMEKQTVSTVSALSSSFTSASQHHHQMVISGHFLHYNMYKFNCQTPESHTWAGVLQWGTVMRINDYF